LSSMAAALHNCSGKNADRFRVFIRRLFIGGEAASEGHQGGLTTPWHGHEGAVPPPGEPALWPPSGSLSVLVLRLGKIGVSAFILSNSENISCVAFLKHKNSRKQGTGTMASCQ
jgi:hypothetical protein